MYVVYVCMDVCMYVCLYGWMYVCLPVCLYVCLYVCMYVCKLVLFFGKDCSLAAIQRPTEAATIFLMEFLHRRGQRGQWRSHQLLG